MLVRIARFFLGCCGPYPKVQHCLSLYEGGNEVCTRNSRRFDMDAYAAIMVV